MEDGLIKGEASFAMVQVTEEKVGAWKAIDAAVAAAEPKTWRARLAFWHLTAKYNRQDAVNERRFPLQRRSRFATIVDSNRPELLTLCVCHSSYDEVGPVILS